MKIGLDVLLPHLRDTKVENVELSDLVVRVQVAARQATAVCPRCGHESARVHSRYRRVLTDVAAGGRRVEIRVRVRRFFCDHTDCPALTFVEQVRAVGQPVLADTLVTAFLTYSVHDVEQPAELSAMQLDVAAAIGSGKAV